MMNPLHQPTVIAKTGDMVFSLLNSLGLLGLVFVSGAVSQASEALTVRTELAPGPYLVGQGFELRIGVIAGGQRPKIDPPRISGARAWFIGTERRPITTSRIGGIVAHESLFVTRFRIVPERTGSLEIPSVLVQVDNRSGRSQPRKLSIQNVPLLGRPAEFLGGVGRFEVQAKVSPQVVRVNQELELRITVSGPAAWGMTDRPDLARLGRLELGLRVDAQPEEMTNEPPSRSFVYRLRPTHAGEGVLPPVAVAAFDPSVSRYVTHVTAGLPIRVAAVPAFDAGTLKIDQPSNLTSWPVILLEVSALLATVFAVFILVARALRHRRAQPRRSGPELARRFAKQTARFLGTLSVEPEAVPPSSNGHVELLNFDGSEFDGDVFLPSTWYPRARPMILRASSEGILQSAARRIYERLASYLLAGTGQSLRVLTPDEAREGVALLSGSQELIDLAGDLAMRCDLILYGSLPEKGPAAVLRELLDDARRLFEALGRVKRSDLGDASAQPTHESGSPPY